MVLADSLPDVIDSALKVGNAASAIGASKEELHLTKQAARLVPTSCLNKLATSFNDTPI